MLETTGLTPALAALDAAPVIADNGPAALLQQRVQLLEHAVQARVGARSVHRWVPRGRHAVAARARLREGDVLRLAGRVWDVRMGDGHAPEHATLWSRDGDLVLGGDQLLASISPNLGVYATEPGADPVGEWLDSCLRLSPFAKDDQLVLPGHKLPYTGLPTRMMQLVDNHHEALARLLASLDTPKTAADCFSVLFRSTINEGNYGLALVEAVAHLNHLLFQGKVARNRSGDGAWLWHRIGSGHDQHPDD